MLSEQDKRRIDMVNPPPLKLRRGRITIVELGCV